MAVSSLPTVLVGIIVAGCVASVSTYGRLMAQAPATRDSGARVTPVRGDSVTIQLFDVDIRAAVSALAPYLDRPVSFGTVPAVRVTLETPHPIARADILRLARGLVESQNMLLVSDTVANMYRVEPKAAPAPGAGTSAIGIGSGGAPGAVQFFVIHLHHARAADVASTINSLYGRASALGESGLARTTLGQQLARNQLPPATTTTVPSALQASPQSAVFTGETSIVPDAGTNSLFIRANRTDFDLITAAVRELDVRPLQVLIEVVIAEIDKNADLNIGVDAAGQYVNKHGDTSSIGLASGLGLGDFVGRVMRVGNPAFVAQLTLAADKGEARILSRPVVLASNNEEAEILVGSQQPFIQVSQTQVGAVAQNQVVQYQAVGTRLLVRPTISGDGYVTLDVTQEVNQATAQVVFNAPVISTRTVRTRLLIRDNQTVVLGGLSDQERDKTSGGIPVLSSIPLIGGLFGHSTRSTTSSEFFLFLTPHIIATDAAADSLTKPLEKQSDTGIHP
jgi:type II secretory pathway component GspD/PulD (secretin)